MNKLLLLLLAFLTVFVQSSYTQISKIGEKKVDTVKIGVYLISLFDLKFPDNQLNTEFYVWFNYSNDSLNPVESFEIINAKEISKIGETYDKQPGNNYRSLKYNCVIKKEWDVTSFPFDKHHIEIIFEDLDKDITRLVFIPDTLNSKIDKSVQLSGWTLKNKNIKVSDHVYETNYGDPLTPADEYSSYSRVVMSFDLERNGNGLFFKIFIGLFISVLISVLVFFVNPTDLDPRFGLSVGAIFAAIASQYVINSTLPQNTALTLVDILHDISFFYIFLCILLSTISLHFYKQDKIKLSKKIDKYSFFTVSISYLILVIFIVTRKMI
jgi:hypothetical protein